MGEKSQKSGGTGHPKTATTLMAYAQLEMDNISTCVPRLCKFSIIRLVLNGPLDGGDSNSVVVAVKIQSNKRMFRCCEIPLQSDSTLDVQVNLQYLITYPHYFKRDINKLQIYVQRRKNRPMIGYKTLARGEISLNKVIQRSQNIDLHLYMNSTEKKQQQRSIVDDNSSLQHQSSEAAIQMPQKHRLVGYVSVVGLSSTIAETAQSDSRNGPKTKGTSTSVTQKQRMIAGNRQVELDKSFGDDEDYGDDDENPSDMEDSDFEYGNEKKKFINPMLIRNKLIKIFKRKGGGTTGTGVAESHHHLTMDRHSDIEEEDMIDPPSDVSDSTVPVDQWSIESVPKPGFTPVEQLQLLKFSNDDPLVLPKTNPFDESPPDSESSDVGIDIERTMMPTFLADPNPDERGRSASMAMAREGVVRQLEDLHLGDRLPETVVFLYTGLNQPNVTPLKFKEYNLAVISLTLLNEAKLVISNLIQRIQKCTAQSKQVTLVRVILLGNDAFVNAFLQSYVDCLASKPKEWMAYFRFYFIPLVSSYLATFLGSLDPQYHSLFGEISSSANESSQLPDIRELVQKVNRYVKTSQYTLSLPIGEVMLNRKGRLPEEDTSPTFLPFFCYVRLGTSSSSFESSGQQQQQQQSLDEAPLTTVSSSPSQNRDLLLTSSLPMKDSSDDSPPQSPPPPLSTIHHIKGGGDTNILLNDTLTERQLDPQSQINVQVDYWTSIGMTQQGGGGGDISSKKEGRTIKSSLKSNIRVLTVTRKPVMQNEGKMAGLLTMTFITREKKQKIMKFSKKQKEPQKVEPQSINGINRLVCTSKSQNVELTVNVDGLEWNNVKFFQISSQWHTHIKYFPLAIFTELKN
ncbi:unnamed protein product [Didymodactylos carnosus]|uniref:Phosphofurin acidic cluster sorting protein 2 n=1 Tax=Didymodactylos carnosus TaxID=1234261 RepID=A0A813W957_9BILA|nr:unnamed protein product [Didymodactylos carnosus]CAF1065403.1 unnamed protein product [Didymodactylos carnosus]CAF3637636.1 unnamed protein product [Didymodactylos carnosus]CAF3830510.1 unnamed protein product [Didymodactylos carnosus]